MKKYSVCLLILISVSLYSCCKKQVIDDILYGTITKLTANGDAFPRAGMTVGLRAIADPNCQFDVYSIRLIMTEKINDLTEDLSIGFIPKKKIGNIDLKNFNSRNCDTSATIAWILLDTGGDLLLGTFKISNKVGSSFFINSYNEKTNEVIGKFDLTMVVDGLAPSGVGIFPDTIRFKCDEFKVIVQ
jgi:hypothetical protein